MNSYHIKPFRF